MPLRIDFFKLSELPIHHPTALHAPRAPPMFLCVEGFLIALVVVHARNALGRQIGKASINEIE